jgi:hypothetical protein
MCALYFTENFTMILARQEVAHKQGINDMNIDDDAEIKDLSSLKKTDNIENEETFSNEDKNKIEEVNNEPTSVKN